MKNIFAIVKLARPLYKLIAYVGVLIFIGAALDMATPFFFKAIIDEATAQVTAGELVAQNILLLIGGLLLVNILASLLRSYSNRMGDVLAADMRRFLTEKFYDQALGLPQRYFDTEVSGKIVNQLNRGVQSIVDFFNVATNFILPAVLQSVFVIVIIFPYSPAIAFFLMALFPIYIFISWRSTLEWGKYQEPKNKLEDSLRGRITEVIANMKLVKSYNSQRREYGYGEKMLEEINVYYGKQSRTFHIHDFLRNLFLNVIMAAIYVIVFLQTLYGIFNLAEMVFLLQLLNQVQAPLFAMSFIISRVKEADAGSKEYISLLALDKTEQLSENVNLRDFENPSIHMDHVSFSYDEKNPVLKDIELTLKNNETIALVGRSGAGKSTLVNLILRLYEPTGGKLQLSGYDYKSLSSADIRHNIALVFQENELFSTTIRDNVRYGRPDATDEEVWQALEHAYAADFVRRFPEGLDAEVGERGVRLSGGQKQRIQIARALLRDAPVLILDEATSSLDAESELAVQNALENLLKHRLVLIIAHRFSTIQNADRIVVIDSGTIVDHGTPAELAKRPGIYSDLLRFQVEGNRKLLEAYEIV